MGINVINGADNVIHLTDNVVFQLIDAIGMRGMGPKTRRKKTEINFDYTFDSSDTFDFYKWNQTQRQIENGEYDNTLKSDQSPITLETVKSDDEFSFIKELTTVKKTYRLNLTLINDLNQVDE